MRQTCGYHCTHACNPRHAAHALATDASVRLSPRQADLKRIKEEEKAMKRRAEEVRGLQLPVPRSSQRMRIGL